MGKKYTILKRWLLIVLGLSLYVNWIIAGAQEKTPNLIECSNVGKFEINNTGPYLEDLKYNYTSVNRNEIKYLIHFINSFELIETKRRYVSDSRSFSIKVYMNDKSIKKYGFDAGRFYISENKKDYMMNKNEYNRFLEFVYALKTGTIKLGGNISFEPSEWAKGEVDTAVEEGIVPKWNQINYQGEILRLEVCQLVGNVLEKEGYTIGEEATYFTDTADESIALLRQLNIINGKTEKLFCPYDFITREELAKILSNMYSLIGNEKEIPEYKIAYTDKESISEWAEKGVMEMTALGILKGNENREFKPQAKVTKEETILALFRLVDIKH